MSPRVTDAQVPPPDGFLRVTMTRRRQLQNVGALEVLDVGETYDLPRVVAEALIATGAARRAEAIPGDRELEP